MLFVLFALSLFVCVLCVCVCVCLCCLCCVVVSLFGHGLGGRGPTILHPEDAEDSLNLQ